MVSFIIVDDYILNLWIITKKSTKNLIKLNELPDNGCKEHNAG